MMKILWIINIPLPEAIAILTGLGDLKASGGWLIGAAQALAEKNDVDLYVASVSNAVSEVTELKGKNMTHILLPIGKGNLKYNKTYESYWKGINEMLHPDLVHIHGTEYTHGLAYVNACGSDNVVVSIQGLKSAYYYYYYYGLSIWEVIKNITLRDLIVGSIFSGKKRFRRTAKYEVELLSKVHHIIGRTSWDKSRTWAINPNAHYHFCNETLREEFYGDFTWNYRNCVKYSIFVSQAGYPIKGLHQLLKAMPIILQHYPNVKIRVAGSDITKCNGIKGMIHFTGYGKIVRSMIKRYGLQNHIEFVGPLNAAEMRNEYLNSNVFVSPSTIENSPNSLGEAQILGVPCISSYVGGSMDLMSGNEVNLYRFDEVEMLAFKVCEVFKNGSAQVNMRNIAQKRHDKQNNRLCLMNIYRYIINKSM